MLTSEDGEEWSSLESWMESKELSDMLLARGVVSLSISLNNERSTCRETLEEENALGVNASYFGGTETGLLQPEV